MIETCDIEFGKTVGHRSGGCSRDRAAPVVFLRKSGALFCSSGEGCPLSESALLTSAFGASIAASMATAYACSGISSDHEQVLPDRRIESFPVVAGYTSELTGGLLRKSAVYGLNGRRAHFVIALSLATYEHAI
jgi:hypothetical protein